MEFDGGVDRQDADRLAYEQTLLAWHLTNGLPPHGWCGGCGKPLDGWSVPMPDGAAVHGACVEDYGLAWRRRAAHALELAGVRQAVSRRGEG